MEVLTAIICIVLTLFVGVFVLTPIVSWWKQAAEIVKIRKKLKQNGVSTDDFDRAFNIKK